MKGSPSSTKSVAAYQAPCETSEPVYEDGQAYDAHNGVHDRDMLVVVEWHITLHIKGFHLKVQGGELTGLCKVQAVPCPKPSTAAATCIASSQGTDDMIARMVMVS